MIIECYGCSRKFIRDRRRLNENIKLNLHNYCSLRCLGKSRQNRKLLICQNPKCKNRYSRTLGNCSPNNYCSRSCAVTVNNNLQPKRQAIIKSCVVCKTEFKSNKTYCSAMCQHKGQEIGSETLLREIKRFYVRHHRVPFKKELKHYNSMRYHFGTFNEAIIAAGFKPNPVMFANKHMANDGHKCDSLSEKIIDDWLTSRKIKHQINFPYPGKYGYTVDFKIGEFWIEFFGLAGEHKRYDELKKKKINLARKERLKLIEVYPNHLFPENKLNEVLGFLKN